MASFRVEIPGWQPARLNSWDGRHWAVRAKAKRADRDLVAAYCRQAGVTQATGPRRVTLTIVLGPRQRGADPDAYWKSTLDALSACGAIVDDSRQWVELAAVQYERGKEMGAIIALDDMG